MMQLQERHYSGKLEKKVSENTVKSINKTYIGELRKRPQMNDGEAIAALPTKQCGTTFSPKQDVKHKVQIYIKKVREGGELSQLG